MPPTTEDRAPRTPTRRGRRHRCIRRSPGSANDDVPGRPPTAVDGLQVRGSYIRRREMFRGTNHGACRNGSAGADGSAHSAGAGNPPDAARGTRPHGECGGSARLGSMLEPGVRGRSPAGDVPRSPTRTTDRGEQESPVTRPLDPATSMSIVSAGDTCIRQVQSGPGYRGDRRPRHESRSAGHRGPPARTRRVALLPSVENECRSVRRAGFD